MCDTTEEHDNEITTELMRMNQTLTEEIINNRDGIYDIAQHQLSLWLEYD